MANFILIRDLSDKRGITLRELAKQVDLTEGAIQKIIATWKYQDINFGSNSSRIGSTSWYLFRWLYSYY